MGALARKARASGDGRNEARAGTQKQEYLASENMHIYFIFILSRCMQRYYDVYNKYLLCLIFSFIPYLCVCIYRSLRVPMSFSLEPGYADLRTRPNHSNSPCKYLKIHSNPRYHGKWIAFGAHDPLSHSTAPIRMPFEHVKHNQQHSDSSNKFYFSLI